MKTTIIYAHPWEGSFNKAILDEVMKVTPEYYLIDLYKDGFNPVMSQADLALYSEGKSTDAHVEKYNKILDDTNRIIFIFPIWWYDMPAILRGFLDKVLLKGSAYYSDETGLHPIRDIQETFLFTTSSTSTDNLLHKFGDPINGPIIGSTFKAVGFHNAVWNNLGGIDGLTDKEREDFLVQIKSVL